MESFKQLIYSHVEKVVLGLAVLFLLLEAITSARSRLDQQTREEVERKLNDLAVAYQKSAPPELPKLTYARSLKERWAEVPVVRPLQPETVWPPVPEEAETLTPWTLTIGQEKSEYSLPGAATKIITAPEAEVLSEAAMIDENTKLSGRPMRIGSTQIVVTSKSGKRWRIPIQVRKTPERKVYAPILLGGYTGGEPAITIGWADDPRQDNELPVNQFEVSRMGPLNTPSQTDKWKNKTVTKEEQLWVRADLNALQLGPPWSIPWRRLGPLGDKMFYFDKNVKPNAWYIYRVTSQATIQDTEKDAPCHGQIAIKTGSGVYVLLVGTGVSVSEELKHASIVVLKWLNGNWEKRQFEVWAKGSKIGGSGKISDGRIGGVLTKDEETVDMTTPYVLLDVTEEIRSIGRPPRTVREVGADGKFTVRKVPQPPLVQRIPKIVYVDTDGFRYAQARLSKGEVDAAITRITEVGPWGSRSPIVAPEKTEVTRPKADESKAGPTRPPMPPEMMMPPGMPPGGMPPGFVPGQGPPGMPGFPKGAPKAPPKKTSR